MKYGFKYFSIVVSAFLLGACGSSDSSQTEETAGFTTAQKSEILNTAVNGYTNTSRISMKYEKEQKQNMADILFVYLLKSYEYFPAIAYTTYKELALGNLDEATFNKKFVVDFARYKDGDTSDNIVAEMVAVLEQTPVSVTQTRAISSRAVIAPRAVTPIPVDILSNKKFYVFSPERDFELTINNAVSQATAKAGFFSVNIDLELKDNYLYTSSSQGDSKSWLEYPARKDTQGDICLCVHSEDVSGKDLGLSYYFTKNVSYNSLNAADTACKSYPDTVVQETQTQCQDTLVYLTNPTTGICTEFTNTCDAQQSGWTQSCTLQNTTSDTQTDAQLEVTQLDAVELNEAMIEAYKIALESNKLSLEALDLAVQYEVLADILLQTISQGSFNTKIVPQLSHNKLLGEKFLLLMQKRQNIRDYVFENLDVESYAALMKSLMFSREASLIFSEILKENPHYLEDGSSLSKLVFNVNDYHGDKIDNANEMFFTAMFSSSAAVSNTLDAVDALGETAKYKYLDFIFLGVLEGKTAQETQTQKYYNLSAIAEGMVVGMRAEPGDGWFELAYTTKLVGYFLTAITPSKYFAYGEALYAAGTDYLAKVDEQGLQLFKGELTSPVTQLDTNASLQESNTTLSADDLHGIQYDSNAQAVQASLENNVSTEQVVGLWDYTVKKKATGNEDGAYYTFIPKILERGSEVVPTVEEESLSFNPKDTTNASFFILTPRLFGAPQNINTQKVENLHVQSTAKEYDVYVVETKDAGIIDVNREDDMHLIVVPW